MSEYISIEQLKTGIDKFFERNKVPNEVPIYKIGDLVKTKADSTDSYITKIIGVGKVGVIISECSIPLIDFGKEIGEFYVYQKKLRLC